MSLSTVWSSVLLCAYIVFVCCIRSCMGGFLGVYTSVYSAFGCLLKYSYMAYERS